MYFLTYLSYANKQICNQDIKSIQEKARLKNQENGLTGLLLYRSRTFFQLLEGSKKDVIKVFEKIANDKRHERIEIISEIEIEDAPRIFPSWEMGLISEAMSTPDQEALIQKLNSIALSKKQEKAKILELLKKFSETLPPSAWEILAKANTVMVNG